MRQLGQELPDTGAEAVVFPDGAPPASFPFAEQWPDGAGEPIPAGAEALRVAARVDPEPARELTLDIEIRVRPRE